MKYVLWTGAFVLGLLVGAVYATELDKPNVVMIFADDISAREIPCYNSTVWSKPKGGNTTDPAFRAKTPALDKLAQKGCWIKTAWSATTCMPSRAMMMTGRFATQQKWWENRDLGTVQTQEGTRTWYLFESSPITLGQVAKMGGYDSVWAGKTQMQCYGDEFQKFDFTEGALSTGYEAGPGEMPNSFKTTVKTIDGKKMIWNKDTGTTAPGYPLARRSNSYKPLLSIMNENGKRGYTWWPNTPESKANFGLNTYGPDLETEYCLDFMERKHKEGKPFFIYHTTHLGHDQFDWLHPESANKWPGTPIVNWDGNAYTRIPLNITGSNGKYDTHGTVTDPGIHSHITYIDYMMWQYMEKVKELGIEENTVFIFCADNGTSGYGKYQVIQQRGVHVPLIIYAPGMSKQGEQDILVSLADVLPTLADAMDVELPSDYQLDGESLWPYLMSKQNDHRDWIYSYRHERQLIRGELILRDGDNKWWNVETLPDDHTAFSQIKNWGTVSERHREEHKKLQTLLPKLDLYATEHDAPSSAAITQ